MKRKVEEECNYWKTKMSVETSSSLFFNKKEEIRGSQTVGFLTLQKVLIQGMGLILNI